jgi:peptidoglycan/LPS O-acetylase OafA/YrhL
MLQTPVLLFDPGYSLGFGVVAPVWTLSVEMTFYVVLPLIAARWLRRPVLGLVLAAAIVITWHYFATNFTEIASGLGIPLGSGIVEGFTSNYASQFPAWAFAFACGMTGAVVYVRMRDRGLGASGRRWAAAIALAAGAAVLVFAYLSGKRAIDDLAAFQVVSLPISMGMTISMSVMFIALSAAPRALQLPFANRPIRWVADVSYGVYLIHFAVIWFALQELSLPQEGNLVSALAWTGLVIPLSMIYGYLSARIIERPIRSWAHRYGRRAAAAKQPDAHPEPPMAGVPAPAPAPASVPSGAG